MRLIVKGMQCLKIDIMEIYFSSLNLDNFDRTQLGERVIITYYRVI